MATAQEFGRESTAEEVTEGLDLKGTRWLVTGCNSGLGHETIRVLALRGAEIVGAARTVDKAEGALDALGLEGAPIACELSDLASVRGAVEAVSRLDPLDGIIANAGIMALPTLEKIAGYERQFFTNHMGHFVLVTGLLDRLKPKGRVVMLSSGAHFYAKRGLELDNLSGDADYEPWRLYGRSKLANILMSRSLAARFAADPDHQRTANAVHPGVIQTNLGRHIPDRVAMYERLRPNLRTVEQGAATQVYVATHPSLATVSGRYFSDCQISETTPEGEDDALAEVLWQKSEEIAASL